MLSLHKMVKHMLKNLEHLLLLDFQGMFDYYLDIGFYRVTGGLSQGGLYNSPF